MLPNIAIEGHSSSGVIINPFPDGYQVVLQPSCDVGPEQLEEVLKKIKCRSLEELGKLVGAPHGSVLKINFLTSEEPRDYFQVNFDWGGVVHVDHFLGMDFPCHQIHGSVYLHPAESVSQIAYIKFHRLHFNHSEEGYPAGSEKNSFPDLKRQGLGTKLVSQMVTTAAEHGYEYIEGTALAYEGDDVRHKKGSPERNGYYTFARLGFNAPLGWLERDSEVQRILARSSAQGSEVSNDLVDWFGSQTFDLESCPSISDLMKSPEGREWWRYNGFNIELRFDLRPDSKSWKTLNSYLESKR